MTIRSDVTIDWSLSPRIITVAAPSTEITIQDLYDTCMSLEAEADAIDNKHIIDCAGKEALGGGTSVGLTATLLNALVAFEARTGPTYTQCNVSGGNLVALESDLETYATTPIHPTAFTQVVITASSSATTQNQEQLEYSTFGGGVTVDVIAGVSGTDYPIGTPGHPVDNLVDAHTIADTRGFIAFNIIGDITLSTIDSSDGHIFYGQSKTLSTITVLTGANVTNAQFAKCTLEGVLDGGSLVYECDIADLEYVNGKIRNCGIKGTVKLGGHEQASFVGCWSEVAGDFTPTIDLNYGTNDVILRDYNGGIKFINRSSVGSPEADTSMDFNSGQVIFDSTISAGSYYVRGIAKVTDNSTGTATVVNETVGNSTATIDVGDIFNEDLSAYTTAGTFGEWLNNKGLTALKFMGLK